MELELIKLALPKLLTGTLVTLELTIFSLLIGFILAILLVLGDMLKYRTVKIPIKFFVAFMRGTPLLVQIFIIYYGLSQFEWIRASVFWEILREPFACALLALALNTSAYTMVIFRGAINSIPKGEIEACKALGMSMGMMFFKILLPRAIKLSLPAYSNEVIMILQGTSLASTITILDLTGVTKQLISQTYAVMELFVLSGVIYLILTMIIIKIFSKLTPRYLNLR
jgi:His/Glu/Gln/Arg/opine family amino acid ABC transporter permease subunit